MYFASQHRHNLEQIINNSIIGHSEDWGFGIFVYRYDEVGVLHSSDVLKGAAYADGDI